MELDMGNLISMLSFDSRIMKLLLDEKRSHSFTNEYPLFYKMRQRNNIFE
jgi:hypothetical protein